MAKYIVSMSLPSISPSMWYVKINAGNAFSIAFPARDSESSSSLSALSCECIACKRGSGTAYLVRNFSNTSDHILDDNGK